MLPKMKPGDLIGSRGVGLQSDIICRLTGSDLSHVAIIGVDDPSLLFESTTLTNLPDEQTSLIVKGVQLHAVEKRVENYDGDMYLYPLREPLSDERRKAMTDWLTHVHDERVPYHWTGIMGLGVELLTGLKLLGQSKFDQVFCSELATKALQVAGVIGEALNPAEQTPSMLVALNCFGPRVTLKKSPVMARPPAVQHTRSYRWHAFCQDRIDEHPYCAACGTKVRKLLRGHHKVPFHIDPTLELVKENVMILCESPSHNCHLVFGHLLDWSSYNVNAEQDAAAWLAKIQTRPRA